MRDGHPAAELGRDRQEQVGAVGSEHRPRSSSGGPWGPGSSRRGDAPLFEVADHTGPLLTAGTTIVHGVVRGDVEVPEGALLVLAATAGVTGRVEIAGRADIHGWVDGSIGVRAGGRLNLHGQVVGDIHVQSQAAARIGGSVRGCILGPGRSDVTVTPTAVIAEHRTARWYR